MTTTTNRLEQLITLLEEARDDHEKFFSAGNNAAGEGWDFSRASRNGLHLTYSKKGRRALWFSCLWYV